MPAMARMRRSVSPSMWMRSRSLKASRRASGMASAHQTSGRRVRHSARKAAPAAPRSTSPATSGPIDRKPLIAHTQFDCGGGGSRARASATTTAIPPGGGGRHRGSAGLFAPARFGVCLAASEVRLALLDVGREPFLGVLALEELLLQLAL